MRPFIRTISALAVVIACAGPSLVIAQPEDRQREPTKPAGSDDPCMRFGLSEPRPGVPGFDPRVPAPRGATSFTGVAPGARDPSASIPAPTIGAGPVAPTDPAYQDCFRRR